MIINAHNFQSPWTPAVNGKNPIAAWVPSRDTAGNGTTTLTDLVGSNNATLTNMNPASDWVSDTAAGGTTALDLTAGTEHVIAPLEKSEYGTLLSISMWINIRNTSSGLFQVASVLTSTVPWLLLQRNSSTTVRWLINNDYRITHTVSSNVWTHFGLTYNGTTWAAYLNGVANGTYVGALGTQAASNTYFGNGFFGYANMRFDDARIFNQTLDAADMADLYASGNGRGVQA